MSDEIKFSDLKPGDVFLCKGSGLLSEMICLLDGGMYSHGAIFDGQKVVQATLHGVVASDIDSLKEELFVDVFRFIKNNHYLDDEGWPSQPVVDTADKIAAEGIQYATDHLILFGLLAVTRDIKMAPFEKKMLRIILDHAMDAVYKILDKGQQPMICSEVVYRCFDEAPTNEKYALRIQGTSFNILKARIKMQYSLSSFKTGADISNHEDEDFEKARQNFINAWTKAKQNRNFASYAKAEPGLTVASCVSPHDLETSPNLTRIGRFQFNG
jgi:hypothetical protein